MRLLSHISTKKHFLAKLTLIRLGFLRVVFSFLGGVGGDGAGRQSDFHHCIF